MFSKPIGRRAFLCFTASAGAGIAAAASGARAFSLQEMTPATVRTYLAACEAPSLHQQLLAEVDAKLRGGEITSAQAAEFKTANRCPICGCPLTSPSGDPKN